jgi:hypothetical protein
MKLFTWGCWWPNEWPVTLTLNLKTRQVELVEILPSKGRGLFTLKMFRCRFWLPGPAAKFLYNLLKFMF